MDYVRRGLGFICIEPAMFLYMTSAFIRMPVFQSMLYEKVCYQEYGVNSTIDCTNTTEIRHDTNVHTTFNHVFLVSSLCLLFPSFVFTILLGSLSDVWSIKKPLVLPFIGLILGDINYIIQAFFLNLSPYYVVISDVLFGVFGGYSAIISTMFSYSVRVTQFESRSERVALLEGAIGLGATIGSFASGFLRQATSYAAVFAINCMLHIMAVVYLILFAHEEERMDNGEYRPQMTSMANGLALRLKEYGRVITVSRESCLRQLIFATFIALSIELFSYSGVSDILFSFLLRRLDWTDKEYGFYRSLTNALGCAMTLFAYPLLRKRGNFSNASLAMFGMAMKVVFLLLLAFSHNSYLTVFTVLPQSFTRFVATGLRAMLGQFILDSEHGRVFALVAAVESVSSILATTIFNGLYPKTLESFDGLMFILTAGAICVPFAIIWYVKCKMTAAFPDEDELERLRRE